MAHWAKDTQSYYGTRYSFSANGRRTTISMHRYLLDAHAGQIVDHRDHDTLNNRRDNIRVCSPSESIQNRRKQTNNTSGFIGVSWHKASGKWTAEIHADGKRLHLGLFNDKLEAVLSRDEAAKRLHGEFAVLNFIYRPLSELTDGLPPIAEL
jgi:hypothetical protein